MIKYKFFLVLILGLSTFACSDLEEEPVGILVPETYFTDVASVEVAMNGVYARLHHRFFLARETSLQIMLRSDMVDIGDLGTRPERVEHNTFTDNADNGNTVVAWGAMYDIISACNLTIFGTTLATPANSAQEERLSVIEGQARFIRALTYYHLVRQFGSVIYIDEPVADATALSSASPNSVEDIYENIVADLEFAKSVLPATVGNKSIPSMVAASAYLASVYLTTGDYANALAEAEEIIGKSIDDGDGSYTLGLEDDFQNLFHYANVKSSIEPIYVLDYIGLSQATNWTTDYLAPLTGISGNQAYSHGGGWTVMVPSLAVYETWDGQDYRKSVSFDTTAVSSSLNEGNPVDYTQFPLIDAINSPRPHIAKYHRYPGENTSANGRESELDYLLMRYAEVLLIAAEAAVEEGDNGKAQMYLNKVRARARNGAVDWDNVKYPPSAVPADHTGTVTVEDVLEERRLELAFEGKRWYDIVRRDLGQSVFGASGLEGAKPNFDYPADYLIPIPSGEVAINPNLGN